VIFVNERCRVDYEAMPAEVRESADQAIDALQNARPSGGLGLVLVVALLLMGRL
jgi:hypothetical protein